MAAGFGLLVLPPYRMDSSFEMNSGKLVQPNSILASINRRGRLVHDTERESLGLD
jgi:hypothetical protein